MTPAEVHLNVLLQNTAFNAGGWCLPRNQWEQQGCAPPSYTPTVHLTYINLYVDWTRCPLISIKDCP